MGNVDSSLKEISEIRSMMERASKFLSLSGLSGVAAGVFGLCGGLAAWWYLDQRGLLEVLSTVPSDVPSDVQWVLVVQAVFVFALAIGSAIWFSTRLARRKGLPVWTATAKLMVAELAIPVGSGALVCALFLVRNLLALIPGTTLVFYGLALVPVSKYTVKEVRYLGLLEIVLGVVALGVMHLSLILWMVGFGFLHMVYGVWVYIRYEK